MRTRKIAEKIKRNAGNKRHHSVTADNLVTCNNTKIIIKQNRTEQNGKERNGTEEKRREQNRSEEKRTERNETERNRTEQTRICNTQNGETDVPTTVTFGQSSVCAATLALAGSTKIW